MNFTSLDLLHHMTWNISTNMFPTNNPSWPPQNMKWARADNFQACQACQARQAGPWRKTQKMDGIPPNRVLSTGWVSLNLSFAIVLSHVDGFSCIITNQNHAAALGKLGRLNIPQSPPSCIFTLSLFYFQIHDKAEEFEVLAIFALIFSSKTCARSCLSCAKIVISTFNV